MSTGDAVRELMTRFEKLEQFVVDYAAKDVAAGDTIKKVLMDLATRIKALEEKIDGR